MLHMLVEIPQKRRFHGLAKGKERPDDLREVPKTAVQQVPEPGILVSRALCGHGGEQLAMGNFQSRSRTVSGKFFQAGGAYSRDETRKPIT